MSGLPEELRKRSKQAHEGYLPRGSGLGFSRRIAAQLFAVVQPFSGAELTPAARPVNQFLGTLHHLMRVRKQQLTYLRTAGWNRLAGRSKFCLPLAVQHDKLPRYSCNLPAWCPFCWGRQIVAPVYDRVLTALLFDAQRNCWSPATTSHGLLELHREQLVPLEVSAKRIVKAIKKCRHFDSTQAHGGILLTTVEPIKTAWRIRTRCIQILDADAQPTYPTGDDWSVRWHTGRLTSWPIACIVGRVCEYPDRLLLGRVRFVRDILNARRGSRLLTSYGVLRNDKIAVQAQTVKKTKAAAQAVAEDLSADD